jgi:integrase
VFEKCPRQRAGRSVWYDRRLRKAEVAGSNPARSTSIEHTPVSVKEGIFRTVWELRKEGYSPSTVEGYGNKLKVLSRIADLTCPESVREVIAGKNCSVAYKEALVFAYCHYVRVNGLVWKAPCYKRQRGLPYIASPEQIGKIIARASRKYAVVFSVLRDTGLRPVELYNLTLRCMELEKGTINVKSVKNGLPRIVAVKPSTLAMLKEYVGRRTLGSDDQLFPDPSAARHAFERYRNDVAKKLKEPNLMKIRLYDLRHFFATMLYHRTKDILYVKEQLGHKRIENTLVYTHLVNFGDDEFVCKVARNSEEAKTLVEQGFDYVATSPEGHMLFKKLK